LIDARMGAEVAEIHALAVGRDPVEAYAASLHRPEESLAEPCTHRAVVYTTLGTAGFVASLVRAFARGEPFPRYVAVDFRSFMLTTDPGFAGLTPPGSAAKRSDTAGAW